MDSDFVPFKKDVLKSADCNNPTKEYQFNVGYLKSDKPQNANDHERPYLEIVQLQSGQPVKSFTLPFNVFEDLLCDEFNEDSVTRISSELAWFFFQYRFSPKRANDYENSTRPI
jgi:hypothetical protein